MTSSDSEFNALFSKLGDLLAPVFSQDWPEIPLERAEGAYLYTTDGRKILDFIAGFAVTNLGHNHPYIEQAAIAQIKKAVHAVTGVVITEPILKLADILRKVTPEDIEMFYFGNSGAEAVEGAFKMARYVTRRPVVIGFYGGFHGRTYGSVSLTSAKSKYRKYYEPTIPGIYFAEYPNPYRCPLGNDPKTVVDWSIASIQQIFDRLADPSQVAAFLIEPVQGEGGYIVPPVEFWQPLRALCDQHGILLITDEVQTGFGRTGSMFASQTFGFRPDIVAMGKAVANGFQMGLVGSSKELMSRWDYSAHGTTFGGNPIACAAAIAVQEIFAREPILENTRKMGDHFRDGMRGFQAKYEEIGDVRGVGLMAAMEFVEPGSKTPDGELADRLLNAFLERGLLAMPAGLKGQVIRCMPPLIVNREQVDCALQIMEDSLKAVIGR